MEELAKKPETAEKKDDLLLFAKIQTALVAVLVLLLVVGGVFAAVQVNRAMRVVNALDMEQINVAVQSLSNTASELEKLDMEGVGKTVEALRGAAQKLAEADIDAVNDGIEALTDAAGNLQNLDIGKLNDLIAALEKTAAQMEATSAVFARMFGK